MEQMRGHEIETSIVYYTFLQTHIHTTADISLSIQRGKRDRTAILTQMLFEQVVLVQYSNLQHYETCLCFVVFLFLCMKHRPRPTDTRDQTTNH